MLEYLKYSVTFDWPARTLAEEVHFQKGFGTITGPNESGKSFMLEMIRWLLFGSKALRGEASTYKKLTGLLQFKVRGESYTIERTANSATLTKGKKPIAVGTKPVNVKIVQIFGYGLDVFDVANVVNQAELTKFGEMKPTERKQMVDNVIGLGIIDALSKMADNERLEASREAKSIKEYVREPVAPEPVDGWDGDFNSLQDRYNRWHELTANKNRLMGALSSVNLTSPVPPKPTQLADAKSLAEHLDRKLALKAELDELLRSVPRKPQWTAEQLMEMSQQHDRIDEYENAQRWIYDHPRPEYSQNNLDMLADQAHKYNQHKSWKHITSTLADLRSKGMHTCPYCEKTSFLSHETIEGLERELARLPAYAAQEIEPVTIDLVLERAKTERFKEFEAEYQSKASIEKPDAVVLSRGEINFHRNVLEEWQAGASKSARADAIRQEYNMMPDYQALLQERQKYDYDMQAYVKAKQDHAILVERTREQEAELSKIKQELEDLEGVVELYDRVRVYETQNAMYSKELSEWTETMEVVKEKEKTSEEWTKAKIGLVDFRTKVKQHLIPSLNIAASALLRQMTGGQREFLQVDDDFNVTVDGQGLHTLSGSGKVVANLALRIGLGRVLTNNVFSVFIGDELDGSMDPDRAENTAQTVRNLSGKVSQILMITHKYPEADYYIKLGNANDR